MHVEVPSLKEEELMQAPAGESSSAVRARVEAAHRMQLDRQGKVNADLAAREMESRCVTSPEANALLKRAIERELLAPLADDRP